MEFVNVLSVALAAEKSVLAVKGMEASFFFFTGVGVYDLCNFGSRFSEALAFYTGIGI